ncbi:MAG: signal recognition particle receptor subunit alpha [Nanoarchaeota archaeon]|mgnify:CR=1 FL=1
MLDKFGSSIKNALKKVASSIFVDTKVIDELVKDLQRALIEADVDLELVYELSEKIRERARQDPKPGISKREQVITIVHEELSNLLGEKGEIKISRKPYKIMFIGLYVSGKTTSISKAALYFSKRGYKVCVIGLDTHRAAAMQQLEQLAEKAKITAFTDREEKNPSRIWSRYKEKASKFDIVIVDTAGRHTLDAELVKEIKDLRQEIKPDEIILSLQAEIGQAARRLVEEFHKNCSITGIFITKMDGTAKGGGALAAAAVTKAPVLFIGTGEKLQDIETFDPTSFISRLLGMGDLQTLLEKTKLSLDKEEVESIEKRLEEGKFTLTDLYEQLKAMRKMGPLSKLTEMIPGFSQIRIPENLLQVQEEKLEKWKYALESMTKKELENPEILDSSRMSRISRGSFVPISEIREMIKQYRLVKKFFGITKGKKLGKRELEKMAKKFRIAI